jgi:CheY-like chemotaxis protein
MIPNPPPSLQAILLVEDSEDDIAIITRAFAQGGIANPLPVVRDGEEALAYLKGEGIYGNRTTHPLPVLVLLDLRLPRMEGLEVLRWIRRQSEFAGVPVVVIIASSSVRDVTLAYQCGANSFLVKPSDFQDVVRMSKVLATYWLAETTAPDTAWRPSITRHNQRAASVNTSDPDAQPFGK